MEITQETRDKRIKILKKNFKKDLGKKYSDILKKIEKGIFEFSTDYAEVNNTPFLLESIYKTKFDELLCVLNSNKLIISKILSNEIKPYNIAFLKQDELNPDKFDAIKKKNELEEFKKNNEATSNAYKCSKCGKSKCTVTEKQIRAGDEPATVFVKCVECGHSFSF